MADTCVSSTAVRLISLYYKPADPAQFMERFERVYAPLLKAIPHVRELRVSPVSHKGRAQDPGFFLMAELIFDDRTKFAEAMCSRENRLANAHFRGFAAEPVTLIVDE